MSVRRQFLLYVATVAALIAGTVLLLQVDAALPAAPVTPRAEVGPAVAATADPGAKEAVPAGAPTPPPAVPAGVAREELAAPRRPVVRGRVQAEDRSPIAGADLQLRVGDRVAGRTRSADDGRFSLPIDAGAPGALLAAHGDFAGATVTDVRGGGEYVVTLRRGVAVSGTVREAGNGAPIEGALVILVPKSGPALAVKSDAQGAFVLGHVNPGPGIFMDCLALGFDELVDRRDLPATLDLVLQRGCAWAPRVLDGNTGMPVEGARVTCEMRGTLPQIWFLEAPPIPSTSQVTDVDGRVDFACVGRSSLTATIEARGFDPLVMNRFLPDKNQEIRLFGLLTIAGIVVDPAGAPVSGATVLLVQNESVQATTDAGGRFAFRGLKPYQELIFGARHPDWSPVVVGPLALPLADDLLRLQLEPGCRIEGTVLASDGTAAAGVKVWFGRVPKKSDNRNLWRLVQENRTTDEQGTFAFRSLPEGAYSVNAGTQPVASQPIQVAAGQTATVTLRAPPCGPIEGACVDRAGQPVAGARVWITAHDVRMGNSQVLSDAQGRFTVRSFEPGVTVELSAQKGGLISGTTKVTTPAQQIVLMLLPPVTMNGRVRSRATGEPIARYSVQAAPGTGSASCEHEDGRFAIKDLPPAAYAVTISAPGYRTSSTNIDLRDDHELEFWLDAAAVWGEVVQPKGGGLPLVRVSLCDPQSKAVVDHTFTDQRGTFTFEAPRSAAPLAIVIGDPERPLLPPRDVVLGGTDPSANRFELRPAYLVLRIRSLSGRALAEMQVALERADTGVDGSVTRPIGADGTVTFGRIYRGPYRVRVLSGEQVVKEAEIVIPESGNHEEAVTVD